MADMFVFIDYLDNIFDNKHKIVLNRCNPFEDYDERKFRERFRLSKTTVQRLLTEVSTEQYTSKLQYSRLLSSISCMQKNVT